VRSYTREAGVRNLEREIAAVCRKTARRRAEGDLTPITVDPARVMALLGSPRFLPEEEIAERTRTPGVAVGLAWTPTGGDVLFVEASRMPGGKALTLTGQLGDVMKESAQAAVSWVRAHAAELGIAPDFWMRSDVHLHVPAGAIPKDGPSAGVTLATALVALLRDQAAGRRRQRQGLQDLVDHDRHVALRLLGRRRGWRRRPLGVAQVDHGEEEQGGGDARALGHDLP